MTTSDGKKTGMRDWITITKKRPGIPYSSTKSFMNIPRVFMTARKLSLSMNS
jgi:hypothetical protein